MAKQARSLIEFARDVRRSKCVVCKIPESIRREMVAAREKKIGQDVVIAWLKEDHGAEITREEMRSHHAGHHDQQLRELEGT